MKGNYKELKVLHVSKGRGSKSANVLVTLQVQVSMGSGSYFPLGESNARLYPYFIKKTF